MYFTREDYKKIQKWLLDNAIKDTEFDLAVTPLQGEETVVFVQNGQNVRVYLKDLANQLLLLGSPDFVNVSSKYNAYQISLAQAISYIPYISRQVGQVITFNDTDNNWRVFQFRGERVNQWNNTTLWIDIIQGGTGKSVIPDQEDLTWTEQGPNMVLKFKDRTYNPNDFSGLGMKILRKNIVQGVNVLQQTDINQENTIYEIRYDFDLMGQTINIPANSVLNFTGGSFKNGTIDLNSCLIPSHCIGIFGDNIVLKGDVNSNGILPDWFLASNDTQKIQKAFDACITLNNASVTLLNRTYTVDSTITVHSNFVIRGIGYGDEWNSKTTNQDKTPSKIVYNGTGELFKIDWSDGPYLSGGAVLVDGVAMYGTQVIDGKPVGMGLCFITNNAPSRNVKITNSTINNFNLGIQITGAEGMCLGVVEISNCMIKGNNYGIYSTIPRSMCLVNIHDNTIEQNLDGGIYLFNGSNRGVCYGNTIISNNLLEGQPKGIELTAEYGSVKLEGNYFENPGGQQNSIHVYTGYKIDILNNLTFLSGAPIEDTIVFNCFRGLVTYIGNGESTALNLQNDAILLNSDVLINYNTTQAFQLECDNITIADNSTETFNENSVYNLIPTKYGAIPFTLVDDTHYEQKWQVNGKANDCIILNMTLFNPSNSIKTAHFLLKSGINVIKEWGLFLPPGIFTVGLEYKINSDHVQVEYDLEFYKIDTLDYLVTPVSAINIGTAPTNSNGFLPKSLYSFNLSQLPNVNVNGTYHIAVGEYSFSNNNGIWRNGDETLNSKVEII